MALHENQRIKTKREYAFVQSALKTWREVHEERMLGVDDSASRINLLEAMIADWEQRHPAPAPLTE